MVDGSGMYPISFKIMLQPFAKGNLKMSETPEILETTSSAQPVSTGINPRKSKKQQSRYIFPAEISEKDKSNLLLFQKHELAFFNHHAEQLQKYIRTIPEAFVGLTQDDIKLYAYCSAKNIKISTLYADIVAGRDIPKNFQQNKDFIANMTKNQLLLFSTAYIGESDKLAVHFKMKFSIAYNLLAFYVNQADNIVNANPNADINKNIYRVPPEIIYPQEYSSKRHNQLLKSIIKWDYNPTSMVMRITTPYTTDPIVVRNIDLDSFRWNIMLIHQCPGQTPHKDTPWVVSFHDQPKSGYLLKYLDSNDFYRIYQSSNKKKQ